MLLLFLACTVCDSPVGEQVRAGVFLQRFTVMAGVALPFAVMAVAIGCYHFLPARER